MNQPSHRPHPWLQFGLRALLLLVLLIATFFGGFATARRIDENAMRQAEKDAAEARNAQQEAELKSLLAVLEERDAADKSQRAAVIANMQLADALAQQSQSESAEAAEPLPPPKVRVYVVDPYGSVYHYRACPRLFGPGKEYRGRGMDLDEAERLGYRECKECRKRMQ
jgi:hypothetical protein